MAKDLTTKVTISIGTEQTPEGNWCATMIIIGLDRTQSEKAADYMRSLFCGEEAKLDS